MNTPSHYKYFNHCCLVATPHVLQRTNSVDYIACENELIRYFSTVDYPVTIFPSVEIDPIYHKRGTIDFCCVIGNTFIFITLKKCQAYQREYYIVSDKLIQDFLDGTFKEIPHSLLLARQRWMQDIVKLGLIDDINVTVYPYTYLWLNDMNGPDDKFIYQKSVDKSLVRLFDTAHIDELGTECRKISDREQQTSLEALIYCEQRQLAVQRR